MFKLLPTELQNQLIARARHRQGQAVSYPIILRISFRSLKMSGREVRIHRPLPVSIDLRSPKT